MKKYFQAPWNTKDIIISIFLGIGLLGIAVYLMNLLDLKTIIFDSEYKSLYMLLLFILQWIVIALPFFILTLKKYKFKSENFGLFKVGAFKTVKLVFWGYVLYMGVSLLANLLVIYTNIKIPGYRVREQILPLFGDGILGITISAILIIAIAPVIEELFFRGFLLRALSNKIGIFFGSILSAFIFALLHLQPSSMIPVFILGLIINSLVIRSKSIIPAIAFHVFNNIVAFGIELLILKEVVKIDNLV